MKRRSIGGLVSGVVSASLFAALVSAAPEAPTPSVLQLKSGPCTFRILDSTGTKPQSGAVLALVSAEDSKPVASVKTDENGGCAITLAAGRYVLSVNEMNLAVLMAASDATLSDCRILLPAEAKPLPVGGAPQGEQGSTQRRGGGAFWTSSRVVVVGGVVVLVGAAAYTVADYQGRRERREDDRDDRPRVSQ
jgi:hypothetical protein